MASFNQAVDIPERQDSIMVVKIKHSARGLADAPQIESDDAELVGFIDQKIKESNETMKVAIADIIDQKIKESNETMEKAIVDFIDQKIKESNETMKKAMREAVNEAVEGLNKRFDKIDTE